MGIRPQRLSIPLRLLHIAVDINETGIFVLVQEAFV